MNFHTSSPVFGRGALRRIAHFCALTALLAVSGAATVAAEVYATDPGSPLLGAAAFAEPSLPPAVEPVTPPLESAGKPPDNDDASDASDSSDKGDWPNISEPGPDMGDYPNSAFTLPKGRIYLEMAPFTFVSADRFTPASYSVPFLFRYGITDDVEFRLLGNGLTHLFGSSGTTGISPLIFDLKVHLWDGKKEWFIPASSLEVAIQSNTASPAFRGGVQPALNMNFDLQITKKTNIEWTVGYAATQDTVDVVTGERFIPKYGFVAEFQQANLNVNQFSAQWAVEHDLTEQVQVFAHGYYNGSVFLQHGAGVVAGAGLFWKASQRLIWFGSCNAGLDNNVAPLSAQIGFAIAI